jgi:hypothetical protein
VDTESALKELVDQANLAEDAVAEIERLRGEMENYGDDYVCQMKSKDVRIQELEDALVEERAKNLNPTEAIEGDIPAEEVARS